MGVHALVDNVPAAWTVVQLRSFFSNAVESGWFELFHFCGRESSSLRCRTVAEGAAADAPGATKTSDAAADTRCCVIRIVEGFLDVVMGQYSDKHWVAADGSYMSSKCVLQVLDEHTLLRGFVTAGSGYENRKARQEQYSGVIAWDGRQRVSASGTLPLSSLPELHPPVSLPRGNVGTPTRTLLALVRGCRLPSSCLRTLGGVLSRHASERKYGAVGYVYPPVASAAPEQTGIPRSRGTARTATQGRSTPRVGRDGDGVITGRSTDGVAPLTAAATAGGERGASSGDDGTQPLRERPGGSGARRRRVGAAADAATLKLHTSVADKDAAREDRHSESEAEEWDRHDSLHPDTFTFRTHTASREEYLFEEDVEHVWDKGDASGLVMYTDAMVWDKARGDFDERTADDFDVDVTGATVVDVYGEGGVPNARWRGVHKHTRRQGRPAVPASRRHAFDDGEDDYEGGSDSDGLALGGSDSDDEHDPYQGGGGGDGHPDARSGYFTAPKGGPGLDGPRRSYVGGNRAFEPLKWALPLGPSRGRGAGNRLPRDRGLSAVPAARGGRRDSGGAAAAAPRPRGLASSGPGGETAAASGGAGGQSTAAVGASVDAPASVGSGEGSRPTVAATSQSLRRVRGLGPGERLARAVLSTYGWAPGKGLGKVEQGMRAPIIPVMPDGRHGIGWLGTGRGGHKRRREGDNNGDGVEDASAGAVVIEGVVEWQRRVAHHHDRAAEIARAGVFQAADASDGAADIQFVPASSAEAASLSASQPVSSSPPTTRLLVAD